METANTNIDWMTEIRCRFIFLYCRYIVDMCVYPPSSFVRLLELSGLRTWLNCAGAEARAANGLLEPALPLPPSLLGLNLPADLVNVLPLEGCHVIFGRTCFLIKWFYLIFIWFWLEDVSKSPCQLLSQKRLFTFTRDKLKKWYQICSPCLKSSRM